MANYSIRNATSVDEVRSLQKIKETREFLVPSIDDPQVCYATDPSSFFLGELDGEIISCISLVKYGKQYAHLGNYVVDKLYRGKGYGLALFKHAMASLSPTHNCGLDSFQEKVSLFENSWGFKSTWINQRYQLDVAHCVTLLNKFVPPADVVVHPAKEVDQYLLSAYDTTAFGASYHHYLNALLESPNFINLAATNSSGDIVGFVSVGKAITEKDGCNIATFFANDGQIARRLLKDIFLKLSKELPERKVVCVNVPVDINPEAKALAEELHGTIIMFSYRMFTMGPLKIPKEKIFSFTSVTKG